MCRVQVISRKDCREECGRILRGHTLNTLLVEVKRWSDLHGDVES
jgi:hypothetical protein